MRGFFNRMQELIGIGSGSRYTRSRSFDVFAEAIRSGQVQRDRGLATPDFQFEGYDGKAARAASMGAQRVKTGVGRMKGPSSFTRRLLGTVVGRMEAYNQELGQRLFQRSASDRPKGMPQAWQQMANALRDRNVGAFTRTVARLTAGMKKKDATAAIRQGLLDLERGRRTAASQALATLIDSAIADAEAKGLRSVSHPENFVPAAIDHTKVDGQPRQVHCDHAPSVPERKRCADSPAHHAVARQPRHEPVRHCAGPAGVDARNDARADGRGACRAS